MTHDERVVAIKDGLNQTFAALYESKQDCADSEQRFLDLCSMISQKVKDELPRSTKAVAANSSSGTTVSNGLPRRYVDLYDHAIVFGTSPTTRGRVYGKKSGTSYEKDGYWIIPISRVLFEKRYKVRCA